MAADVIAHCGADGFGHVVDIAQQILGAMPMEAGVALERGVGVRHIRGVVLVVVDPHGPCVDMWLERGVIVR